MADLWNNENPIKNLGIDVPAWIDQDISPQDVAAINQGGCSSGAYMLAATYHQALTTMNEHGDDVLQYLEDAIGEIPSAPKDQSWAGIAVFYLSAAVELWASCVEAEIEEALDVIENDE